MAIDGDYRPRGNVVLRKQGRNMSKQEALIIFDTTLRDGEQSPGAAMNLEEKVTIAKALERLKVDVIEAGFPISSPGDFDAVHAIAKTIKDSTVCGLARSVKKDIETAAKALKPAPLMRIHTFLATSPIHMKMKLKMTEDEVVQRAVEAVRLARNFTDNVEFSPEDAGRSELGFLCRVIEQVIRAGATTINIPDTVGYNLPEQFGTLIRNLIENVPNSDQAIFSSHCHNDLGLAVANSLSAVLNGARQVECTINGLGERAGNASLEEVVMTVKTRKDAFMCATRLDTTQLVPCSKLVSSITGFTVQRNKAIVGINAFAHESGIHQDGVLKSRETYEIMRAQDVGWETNRMVLGKLSGRNALKARLTELGCPIEDEEAFNQLFRRFKVLADEKHELVDEDLIALVTGTQDNVTDQSVILKAIQSDLDGHGQYRVVLELETKGKIAKATAKASNQVQAAFEAIKTALNTQVHLKDFSVKALGVGKDALFNVTLSLSSHGKEAQGKATRNDMLFASVEAYMGAFNRFMAEEI